MIAPSASSQTPPQASHAPPAASSAAGETPTPEQLAKRMRGWIQCGTQRCKAGVQVCVAAPNPAHKSHCEPIRTWDKGWTPVPRNGTPPMAGITACDGSHQCPDGSVCCLHEIGDAEVQAVVCHASLRECRDREELCDAKISDGCRTPGTRCDEWRCIRTGP